VSPRTPVQGLLRNIAGFGLSIADVAHFEWVWDGDTLWIVQADRASVRVDEGPRTGVAKTSSCVSMANTRGVVPAFSVPEGRWRKIDSQRVLRECHLPSADIWALFGEESLIGLCQETVPQAIIENLQQLLSAAPIVIRTD